MSIISKLKGDKKANDDKPKGASKGESGEAQGRPTDTNRRGWSAENMRQINRTTQPMLSRTNSEYSVRSSRARTTRPSSGLSQEWIPSQRGSSSSLKPISRNTSFQGLAKVMEDGNDETPYDIPPMPAMPARYSSSAASSSRPRASRSPFSAAGSSIGKSPLSSAETSPVDSEDSSNASSKSDDILEMRSHPFSHPEQFVFRKDSNGDVLDKDLKGKGKAPMYSAQVTPLDQENVSSFTPMRERKYFTRATPTGAPVSDIERIAAETATETASQSAKTSTSVDKKKSRFSFLKKTEVAA